MSVAPFGGRMEKSTALTQSISTNWLRCPKPNETCTSYLGLGLRAHVSFGFGHLSQFVLIDCVNAVDFSIRPPNGATLMGGPPMEFYEQHPRLENISQTVPNTDGMEVFTPPVKFTLLVMDQSHIIAQRFELRIENEDIFKNAVGMDEPRRQQQAADLQRGLA